MKVWFLKGSRHMACSRGFSKKKSFSTNER